MQSIDAFLKEKLMGIQRLAILGAGSVLKADDAAGVRIVEHLQGIFGRIQSPALLLCVGETAPENFCGKIEKFRPSHLLLVDAADVGRTAGEIVEIPIEDVGGPTFCSHMLPLRVMVDYLVQETGVAVTLLGIQYQSIAFDGEMTAPVASTVTVLSEALQRVISSMKVMSQA